MCLGYINYNTEEWECVSGIKLERETMIGYTNHLSDFAVVTKKYDYPFSSSDSDEQNENNLFNDKNYIAICILLHFYLYEKFFVSFTLNRCYSANSGDLFCWLVFYKKY